MDHAAALREGREAEERHQTQEVAREQERMQEREFQRDRGHGIER